jgi:hypothetical protein
VNRCRIVWYERGRIRRHVAHRQLGDSPADEPGAAARLRTGPHGLKIVEAEMDGSTWYGRLTPKKEGQIIGPVLLFEKPTPRGE